MSINTATTCRSTSFVCYRLSKAVFLVIVIMVFLLSFCACGSSEESEEKLIDSAIQGQWRFNTILGIKDISFQKGNLTVTEISGLTTFFYTGYYKIDVENEMIELYETHATTSRSDYPDVVVSHDTDYNEQLSYSYNSKSGEITLWWGYDIGAKK